MRKAAQKVYIVDKGFVQAKGFNLSDNLGRLLENQVFLEFLRRGYGPERTLFYFRSRNDREVDFVLLNGTKVESLVQVCYDLSHPKAQKREVDAIMECADDLSFHSLTIVTNSEEREIVSGQSTVRVVPVWKF